MGVIAGSVTARLGRYVDCTDLGRAIAGGGWLK